jgi:Cu-Zn family superoxide dismutase
MIAHGGVGTERRGRTWRIAAALVAVAAVSSSCRLPYVPGFTSPPPAATANLVDANGRVVGHAVFLQQGRGVRILLDVTGLPPGGKAVHIHEFGRCDRPGFESAGAHFNPAKSEHGASNPRGPHAGDLPDIAVDPSGRGHLETTATRVTLEKGATWLLDPDGSALVIHDKPDDNRTDPDGNSGARIACGVINPAG